MPAPISSASPASNLEDWCVDDGTALRTMSLVDLWRALGTGDVDPEARVWREGMEAWERAIDVPDLACALGYDAPFTPAASVVDLRVRAALSAPIARHFVPIAIGAAIASFALTAAVAMGRDAQAASAIGGNVAGAAVATLRLTAGGPGSVAPPPPQPLDTARSKPFPVLDSAAPSSAPAAAAPRGGHDHRASDASIHAERGQKRRRGAQRP